MSLGAGIRGIGRATISGWLAAILGMGGCGRDCPLIRQSFVVVSPDPALQALADSCLAGQPAPGETCTIVETAPGASIACGCLPLCRRLLEISGQFSGIEEISQCYPVSAESLPITKQTQEMVVAVSVAYRPTSCP